MTNGMNSLRTRLLAVAKELIELKSKPGKTSKSIALDVVRHHTFRRELTHKLASAKSNKPMATDAWVVLYQVEREDGSGKEYTRSSPYFSKDDAFDFFHKQWGDNVDQSLINLMVQCVVREPEIIENSIEDAARNLAGYIDDLIKHFGNDPVYLGFPEGYNSKEMFLHQVEKNQNIQLDKILSVLNGRDSVGLIQNLGGKKGVLNEQQWKGRHGTTKPYPADELRNVELKFAKPQSVYPLIAIEEYLFFSEGDHLLFALAKSHSVMHTYYNASKIRDSMTDNPDIGLWIGQDNLIAEIKRMTATGFDFQPVFNQGKQCIGTIELNQVMMYLQNHNFDSLPQIIDRHELAAAGLLSPAPPIVDARLPLHRVNEIMYYGIGCVLVRYDPELWTDEEQEFLNAHLKPGLHIFTKHDYVMSQTV